jgi:hypothetical protein
LKQNEAVTICGSTVHIEAMSDMEVLPVDLDTVKYENFLNKTLKHDFELAVKNMEEIYKNYTDT